MFVHGCFWHRHLGCSRVANPGTNQNYWQNKFDREVLRDIDVQNELTAINITWFIAREFRIRVSPTAVADEIELLLKRVAPCE